MADVIAQPAFSIPGIDPLYLAQSKFRRGHWQECIDVCTALLFENPYDKAVWFLKCKALKSQSYIDDSELEELGIAEMIMDDNAMATMPRPGTSINNPGTSRGSNGNSQAVRPTSSSHGYLRPSTQNRLNSQNSGKSNIEAAFKGSRPGSSRPVTSLGRQIRLGTASMLSGQESNTFIDVEQINLRKYAARPSIGKALCDYLIYHEHNPKKAIELAAHATNLLQYEDWWWKSRLGKCYYILDLFREAEQQLKSSLKNQKMVSTYLDLCKVYLRLNQPKKALELYKEALEEFPNETHILLAIARTHDLLLEQDKSIGYYRKVLELNPVSVEAIASLACNFFYADQPEIALKFYRRLVEMGQSSPELWNNLGMCCFHASQYDITLSCLEKALSLADDEVSAEIMYNIGQVGIGIGDLGLAYQALKVAISINPKHAEAYNNLGVLELRKGNPEASWSNFDTSCDLSSDTFEPYYNGALLAYKNGDFQRSYRLANTSKTVYEGHTDTDELLEKLKSHLC